MSYRALFTICENVNERRVDYALTLDDDFKNGEELAELLGKSRKFDEAMKNMECIHVERLAKRHVFYYEDDREEWRDTYADQTWEVDFTPDGSMTKVEITGKDAGGTMIFYRSTVYG